MARCLHDIAKTQALALVVDDLQWADADSLRVLHYLASGAGSSRILVILLVRDDQLTMKSALGDVLGRLQREESFQELRLRGLDRLMIGQLVADLARRPIGDAAVSLINDATNGNPYYSLELARHLIDERLIDRVGEAGSLLRIQDVRIPEGLRSVIERRLLRLDDTTQSLLRLAAICGDTFDDADLVALSSRDEIEVLDAIDTALAAQLIRPSPSERHRYHFVHQLMQHTLADSWAPSRRIRLHRTLADGLASAAARGAHPQSAQIARHYLASATLPGAEAGIPFAIAAAAEARRVYDLQDVVRNCRIALELAADLPARARADILMTLMVAESEAFLLENALRTTTEALTALEEDQATPGERARFIAVAVTTLHDSGMPNEAWMPVLNLGLELTPADDRQTWARLTLLIQRFEVLVEGVINGSRWLGSNPVAVEIARSCGDEELYARSLQPWDLWDRTTTERLSERIRTWHKPAAIIRALTVCSADWLYHQGDFRRSLSEFEDLRDISLRHYSIPGQAEAYVRLAICHFALGNLASAEQMHDLATTAVSRLGPGHRLHASLWWVQAFRADYQGGDWQAIAAYLVRYVADPNIARGTIALDDAALAALALVRAGNIDVARQLLTTLDNVLPRLEPDLWLLNGTVALAASAVWELGVIECAPNLLAAAQTLIERGHGDFPCTSLDLTIARMATLLRDHDVATVAFASARTRLEQSGQRPLRVMVDLDQAIALADYRREEYSRAQILARSAIDRFGSLGMSEWADRTAARASTWPDHDQVGSDELGALSPREIEVLQLVARGFSDRQIGDQMFVSPRTVHAHIRNMLAKTQTSNRTELSIWAMERDLLQRS